MRPHRNQPVRAIIVSPQEPGLKLEELLDRKAVAKLLGVATATLKTWVCERKAHRFTRWALAGARGSTISVRTWKSGSTGTQSGLK